MNTPILQTEVWPIQLSEDPLLRESFDLLRRKWGEVPYTAVDRVRTTELLALSDREILDTWTQAYLTNSTGKAFSIRGWYQTLYRDSFRGKKVLDVGCGLGPDSIFFAENGALVTCLDIVEANLEFVKRVCRAKGLKEVSFCYMEDLNSLATLPKDYDVIYCCGSFINAPLELARMEAQSLLEHLPMGGRWIELAYPKHRWEREGRMPFSRWGEKTDGGAPWMEWHDLEKLRYMLAPVRFDVILNLEFHNSDFNWFDLVRRSTETHLTSTDEVETDDELVLLRRAMQDNLVSLQNVIEKNKQELARMSQEKQGIEILWDQVQSSAGWRALNMWRKVRQRVAPPNSFRRKLYDQVVTLRGRRTG